MPARRVFHSQVQRRQVTVLQLPLAFPIVPHQHGGTLQSYCLGLLSFSSLLHSPERSIDFLSPIMQAQMMLGQALEHYTMMDFANLVLEQCWDICYDSQLTRPELAGSELPDVKVQKMDACARKCVARHFEVLSLLSATRELRERERMQGLPPGTLTNM
ncbi:Tim10/DDP family zinc finger containing protein, putative [Leishmania shawi]|uniref:Tim10/DDP family zinc finger containing protein n=1 Tax=Leishmania shawi TaxID=5680 RepID=A0ABR3EDQ6_9TRYP